ncbi:MAG: mannonate dehydratase [Gammaproteobacteria bacterium]|nr:mannonate dehydratase [Gammaproteobacteria bacterium]
MAGSSIKFSAVISSKPSDEELLFVRQLGVEYVYTYVGAGNSDVKSMTDLRLRVADAGITLYDIAYPALIRSDKIHLGLPGRDEAINEFKNFVRNVGRAGIQAIAFIFSPNPVWTTGTGESRGAKARRVDLDEMLKRPLTHGREYTEDEIWDNFSYFVKEVIPVAEEAKVRLALHPNDPPVPSLGGIPCLIHSFEDYKRAFEIADSPYLGMEFCVGCWLEGAEEFGDMFEAIPHFQNQGKIVIVNFRNVSSPLPRFTETFVDAGYMDMYQVMKAFVEVGYQGIMILDHTPKFSRSPSRDSERAYAIGYMRALMERAEAELNVD